MSAEPALQLVETEPVEEKALTIVDQAKAVKVIDSATYTAAGSLWKAIGDMIKEVKDTFDPICDAAHKAHKQAVEKRSKYLDPLASAQKSVKQLMSAYDAEQERVRQAEQRRLEEIARKEEAERRLVELERLEAERKAEEERALAAAIQLEKLGDMNAVDDALRVAGDKQAEAQQEAAAIQAEPVYIPPVILPKETPKIQGLSFRTAWKYRITTEALIPRQYLIPDEKKIGAVIRASQGKINIPGITPYEERV